MLLLIFVGSDINVPPPTLTASKATPLGPNEVDDGQYREDPAVYYKDQKYSRPVAASKFSLNNYQQPRPQPAYNSAPAFNHAPAYRPQSPAPAPAPQYYNPAPQPQQPYYQPNYYSQPQAPQPQYNPYNPRSSPANFHPAVKSLDIWSGSYSLDYTGRK